MSSTLISDTPQWKALVDHAETMKKTHLRDLLQDHTRCDSLVAFFDTLFLDYSRQILDNETMNLLFDLANSAGLLQKIQNMYNGTHINNTEDRAVLHIALRSPSNKSFFVDGVDVVPQVHNVLNRIKDFSEKVRSGVHVGVSGKKLTNIICVGIGGSYLGPEFIYEALRTNKEATHASAGRSLKFIANVDPDDAARALKDVDPETTLVIILSKTFTTQETMINASLVKNFFVKSLSNYSAKSVISKHMIAVSTAIEKTSVYGIEKENVFEFWDWVGGRYSVTSAVGILPLSLHYGFSICQQFLNGCHSLDSHFGEANLRENLPVLLGLIGIWNASFLNYEARAILPYSQALLRFPAHIQQVDMESNGKRVSSNGEILPYQTGEIIFGEPGTNGQHSFYQLIHQGRIIPCEFIGYCKPQDHDNLFSDIKSQHDDLMSNFFAQPDALAYGKTEEELVNSGCPSTLIPHKVFPGNRPSLSLLINEMNAYTLGQLLALYEHRVAVQGFLWDINSFDQWGVELGKVLATRVRGALTKIDSLSEEELKSQGFNHSTSLALKYYAKLKK